MGILLLRRRDVEKYIIVIRKSLRSHAYLKNTRPNFTTFSAHVVPVVAPSFFGVVAMSYEF